jgi:hypothetical protein
MPMERSWDWTGRGLKSRLFNHGPSTVQDDAEEFSWNDEDCFVVPHQAAIAVYFNPRGDVIIRQEGHYGTDEGQWIVVSKENLVPLILRLQKTSGEF